MCLVIDDREDTNLYKHLVCYDLSVERTRLEFGDACFEGCGPKGPALVGIERKHLADVAASMQNRRLAGHQLRGMWQHFDYCYLVVEDLWRPDSTGGIEINRNGKWYPFFAFGSGVNFRQLDSFLNSLEIRGNLVVVRSCSMRETAAIYASRYMWWKKRWDDHHSHEEIYSPGPEVSFRRGKAHIATAQPGVLEKVAAQLPGIDRKAWDVARRFGSVEAMTQATVKEWMEIPGIGKGIATQVVAALKGERK